MKRWKRTGFIALAGIVLLIGGGAAYMGHAVNMPVWGSLIGRADLEQAVALDRLKVPDGFSVNIYVTGIKNARIMTVTPVGDILVSSPRTGKIYLVKADGDDDGKSDGVIVLKDGLKDPHGIALHDGWLYIAETNAVGRIRFNSLKRAVDGNYEHIIRNLPSGGGHWTRSIKFGPDGKLYLTIGSSCNVCIEDDPRRATMMWFNADGSDGEIYASGLRNSVGFDWSPDNGALYATDNGRDMLGDDFPPCELNRIKQGGFYGWPYANGYKVPDPDFGKGHAQEIASSLPPVHGFAAHVAPLGITFLHGTDLPVSYRGAALVALHGSWNRTKKSGYKVVLLTWDDKGKITERDFMTGFEINEDVIGRPVDVAEGRDGSLYVSDDYTGTIYRIHYTGNAGSSFAVHNGGHAQSELAFNW